MGYVEQVWAKGRKYRFYNALPVIVFAVLGAPTVLIHTGSAEQYVAEREMPVGGDTASPLPIRKYK